MRRNYTHRGVQSHLLPSSKVPKLIGPLKGTKKFWIVQNNLYISMHSTLILVALNGGRTYPQSFIYFKFLERWKSIKRGPYASPIAIIQIKYCGKNL